MAALVRLLSLAGVARELTGGAAGVECGWGTWEAMTAVLLRRGLFADPVEALSWLAIAGPPGPARPDSEALEHIAAVAAVASALAVRPQPVPTAAGGGRGGADRSGLRRSLSFPDIAAAGGEERAGGGMLQRSSSS